MKLTSFFHMLCYFTIGQFMEKFQELYFIRYLASKVDNILKVGLNQQVMEFLQIFIRKFYDLFEDILYISIRDRLVDKGIDEISYFVII
ncbi:hypothetical protein D3C86_1598450 [compost metagenome]